MYPIMLLADSGLSLQIVSQIYDRDKGNNKSTKNYQACKKLNGASNKLDENLTKQDFEVTSIRLKMLEPVNIVKHESERSVVSSCVLILHAPNLIFLIVCSRIQTPRTYWAVVLTVVGIYFVSLRTSFHFHFTSC